MVFTWYKAAVSDANKLDSAPSDTGSYYLVAAIPDSDNLNGTSQEITVTLAVKPLTAAIDGNTSKTYDATTNADGLSLALTGVETGDIVIATADGYAYDDADAGQNKTITASGITLSGQDADYYTINASASATGAITPADLTVTAADQTKTYGDKDPKLTYTDSGLMGQDVLTGQLTREKGEDTGKYAITQGSLSAGANYTIVWRRSGMPCIRRRPASCPGLPPRIPASAM